MELAYALVLLGVILLYCQLILGHCCRWSDNWLLRKAAEAANKLPNLVGSIASAAMPQGRTHSPVVWILYLAVLNNSMVVYDRENRLLYLWTGANILLGAVNAVRSVAHAGLGGSAATLSAYALAVGTVLASATCQVILVVAGAASESCSEELAKYMQRQRRHRPASGYHNSFDLRLQGYSYAVNLEPLTTVDQICAADARVDGEDAGLPERRRKDLCLSFALFRLLFRRYHGHPCDEAGLSETRDLVFDGLLPPGEDRCRRGFGVVEVELGFLHDHVHGGYVLWKSRHQRAWYYTLVVLKAILMYAASPALYLATGHGHDLRPVVSLLLLHLAFDLLQVVCYYRSDRWMVSYMCRRVAQPQPRQHFYRRMIASTHFRLACWNMYWRDRIGQYSLLEETTTNAAAAARGAITIGSLFLQQRWNSHSARQSAPSRVPRHLRASIARVLRATGGTLDGVPSLERSHGLPPGERRCDENTHKAKIILKWHGATSYCEIALRRLNELPASPAYEVAAALSRYCAYLVAFRSDLLPFSDSYTRRTFRGVLEEVRALLGDHLPNEDRFHALEQRRQQQGGAPERTVTLSDGLDLGHLLVVAIQDRDELWGILENIWVKLILSVTAPQQPVDAGFAKRHAKYLARGGEFVTHLWAMLSHAGILRQNSWPRNQVHDDPQRFLMQIRANYTF